ncbi:MAG: GNAT family N-acetyltransferase [Noviherbaspirillum sp.]
MAALKPQPRGDTFPASLVSSAAPQAAEGTNPAARDGLIECYQGHVPAFVEEALERLYGNLYASLRQMRLSSRLEGEVHTYVARDGAGAITAIFLFRRNKAAIRVLNEGMRTNAVELGRFADYAFGAWRDVDVIAFHAVAGCGGRLDFPTQCFNCSDDYILALPDSEQQYRASLGKSTRSYVNRYLNKLKRDFPSFTFQVYEEKAIPAQLVRDIVELNRTRMAEKGKVSAIDAAESERMVELAADCGLVCVASIDGRLCAGMICYRIRQNYFMAVIAHESAYNDYRIGTLCCYLGIGACIARKGREFHFLWGKYDYKSRLGGVQRELDDVLVYRSPAGMLRQARLALRTEVRGRVRQAKLWMDGRDQNSSRTAHAVLGFLKGLRSLIGKHS